MRRCSYFCNVLVDVNQLIQLFKLGWGQFFFADDRIDFFFHHPAGVVNHAIIHLFSSLCDSVDNQVTVDHADVVSGSSRSVGDAAYGLYGHCEAAAPGHRDDSRACHVTDEPKEDYDLLEVIMIRRGERKEITDTIFIVNDKSIYTFSRLLRRICYAKH